MPAVGKDAAQSELPYIAGGNAKWTAPRSNSLVSLLKWNTPLAYKPAIPPQDVIHKKQKPMSTEKPVFNGPWLPYM